MKKEILVVFLVLAITGTIFSSDVSVNFSVNYNYGVSPYFEKTSKDLLYSGISYTENVENQLGIGFNMSVNVPIIKNLFLVPAFGVMYGSQEYEFVNINDSSDLNNFSTNYFFYVYSGELSFLYDFWDLKNGWKLNISAGFNYNSVNADADFKSSTDSYWGFQTGLGAKFVQLKHFGFQFFAFYRVSFRDNPNSYIGSQAGIFYRF